MVLDHINGDGRDNRIGNLRMLCPNCNSQQDTFAGKKNKGTKSKRGCAGCGKELKGTAKTGRCSACRPYRYNPPLVNLVPR